jgi:hypothetical protein
MRFDEAAEAEIRSMWTSAAAFYDTGYVLNNGLIPHVALLVGDERLQEIFKQLSVPNGEIRLAGIGFFSAGEVTYLNAIVDDYIVKYHEEANLLASRHGCLVEEYYDAANWVPHCTIAQYCKRNRSVQISVREIKATIASLILVKYPPTVLVAEKYKA